MDALSLLSPAATALGLSQQLTKSLEEQEQERQRKLRQSSGTGQGAAAAMLFGQMGADNGS